MLPGDDGVLFRLDRKEKEYLSCLASLSGLH